MTMLHPRKRGQNLGWTSYRRTCLVARDDGAQLLLYARVMLPHYRFHARSRPRAGAHRTAIGCPTLAPLSQPPPALCLGRGAPPPASAPRPPPPVAGLARVWSLFYTQGRVTFLPWTFTLTYTKERPIGAIGAVRARAGRRALIPCMVLHLGRTQHMSSLGVSPT